MANREFVLAIKADPAGAIREFQKLGDSGQAALKRIADASNPASSSLKAVNAVSNELAGRIDDLAGRAGIFGRVLSGFGPSGIAAAAGIGGLTAAFVSGTRELAKYEEAVGRLKAVLTATGNTTGLTIGQIQSFADEIEKSTGATEEQVLQATAALATFGSVSGDNLKRVIRLGQDLSATFGGDLVSNAQQLAAAIANPAEGLGRLDKNIKAVLGSNTALIEDLLKTGKTAEATALLINTLEQKLGGAGNSRGLIGATDQLGKAWEDLLKAIGNTGPVQSAIEGLTALTNTATKLIENKALAGLGTPGGIVNFLAFSNDPKAQAAAQSARNRAAAEKDYAERRAQSDSVAFQAQQRINEIYAEQQTTLEKQNKEATKIADAAKDRILSLKDEVRFNELKLKGDERNLFIQQKLAQLPQGTGQNQIAQASKLADQIYAQNKALEEQKKLQEDSAESAKKAAELWNRPVLKAAEDIQDAFSDAFVNIFEGGVKSFGDLGKQIKSIFIRTIAEILSANLVRPIASSLLAPLLTTGSAQAATGGGGLSGSSLLSLGSNLLPTGGLVTGAINGLGLSGLTGALGLTTTAAGPTLSGAAGFAAGLTGFGSIALPVAGIGLGLLASGLLGNKKPSNKSAGAFIDPNSGSLFQDALGSISGVSTPKGTENLDRFNQVAAQINSALASIKDLSGGTFNGGLFNVALGSRDKAFTIFNGKKQTYANDEDLIFGAVKNALQGLSGASPEIASIISGFNGNSLNDLLTAIARPKQRSDFSSNVADELLGITDPTALALKQLEKEKQERIKQAQDIGADIVAVEKLYAEKRKQVVEQSNGNIYQQQQTLSQALLGSLSALTGEEKYNFAKNQFQSVGALALSGDSAAKSAFGDIFNQFLSTSRDYNASSSAFKNDFTQGVSLYQQILGGNKLDLTGSSAIVESINRQTEYSRDDLKSLRDGIDFLTAQIQIFASRITRLDNRPAGSVA